MGCKSWCCYFLVVSFVKGLMGLATLLLFHFVTGEAGRKYVMYMPWPQAAECNMITNKQTPLLRHAYFCRREPIKPSHSRHVHFFPIMKVTHDQRNLACFMVIT